MILKNKFETAVLLTLLLSTQAPATEVLAAESATQETSSIEQGAVKPAFDDPAEAMRAATNAKKAALNNGALKDALAKVESAQKVMEGAHKSDNQDAIAVARTELERAETAYMRELADVSGVIESDLASMRDSGMGWGQIGHELGVHPGVLGLGHGRGEVEGKKDAGDRTTHRGVSEQELHEATVRNIESGWSKEHHGLGVESGVGSSGTGFLGSLAGHKQSTTGVSGAGGLGHQSNSGHYSDSSDNGYQGSSSGGSSDHSGSDGNSGGSGNSGGHGGSGGNSGGSGDSGGHGGSGGNSGGSGDSGGHGGSGGDSGGSGGSGGHN
jgi:hypothetical protein